MTRTVSEHICDFCFTPGPVTTWCLPEGKASDIYAADPTTGRSIQVVDDTDGKWAACQDCHDGILVFKKAWRKRLAARKFVAGIAKRAAWKSRYTGAGASFKELRKQQEFLYARILTDFENFIPFVGWLKPGETVTLEDKEEVLIPPRHIPDGSTRGRRLA